MKYLKSLILLTIAAVVSGCGKNRDCGLEVQFGESVDYDGYRTVYCDSFQMITTTEAYAFIDSTKMLVVSERLILPSCK